VSDTSSTSGLPRHTEPSVRVAQRVGPQQVGHRVVLRRRLPGGGVGDLLGDLVRWAEVADEADDEGGAEPRVTVLTRAGEVTVAVRDVLGGKPVPPAPARRGRPHRTIDWRDLEDVACDGWRPVEQEWLSAARHVSGWRLRAADGFTGRANSALAVGDPGLPLAEAVDRVEAWYAARGLAPRVAVPWPLTVRRLRDGSGSSSDGIDTDLDRELAARGYRLDTPTLVLTAAAREVAVATTPVGGARSGLVRLDDQPDDEWLATYHYRGQRLPAVARALLLSAPRQVFASVRDDRGRALAVARGASSRGWTGVTAMEVDPAHRRQGLARALLGRLSSWAVELGDESMYLQVAEANAGARALYAPVGFAAHHGYHYRVRD
jgi:GNAT superfamily N-acetyltransferase